MTSLIRIGPLEKHFLHFFLKFGFGFAVMHFHVPFHFVHGFLDSGLGTKDVTMTNFWAGPFTYLTCAQTRFLARYSKCRQYVAR